MEKSSGQLLLQRVEERESGELRDIECVCKRKDQLTRSFRATDLEGSFNCTRVYVYIAYYRSIHACGCVCDFTARFLSFFAIKIEQTKNCTCRYTLSDFELKAEYNSIRTDP